MTQQRPNCPKCETQLVFSGDGRAFLCERCGHRQSSGQEKEYSVKGLVELERLGKQMPRSEEKGRSSARIWLADGDNALKNKRFDDAYFAYSFVLKTQSTDEERALAWLGLSYLFDKKADRRNCLEYALLNNPRLATASREIAILEGRLKRSEIVDPNRIQDEVEPKEFVAETFTFDCPQCSASISHDATSGTIHCQFCGYQDTIEHLEEVLANRSFGEGPFEQEFISALATAKGHLNPLNQRSFGCGRCGAQFILDESTLSLKCPFCESSYVTEAAETAEVMAPSAIIPFSIPQENAIKIYKSWLRENVPKRQRGAHSRFGSPIGFYLPIWTFDLGGSIAWKGYIQKDDRKEPVSGIELPFFDDIVIPASEHNNRLIHSITKDIPLDKLSGYTPAYLAGWPAERYTLPLADAAIQARRRVVKGFRRQPYTLTGRRGVEGLAFQTTDLMVESFKLLYIPLWVGHYRLEKKEYEVYIHGASGEIAGEKPEGLIRKAFKNLIGAT